VSGLALSLVLIAAFAHAGWNLFAKTAEGGITFVWLGALAGCVLYLPVLLVALVVEPGRLGATAFGFMVVSGALHSLYFVLLQRGYRDGDLSLVYPLARGTGPLLATIAAIAFFAERPSPLALAGAALIVAAVFSLATRPSRAQEAGVVFALLTGVSIAAYTLWDKQAVGDQDLSPIVYFWGLGLTNTLLLSPWVLRRPDAIRRSWESSGRQALAVGLLSPPAYILVLYALAEAPVSYVAPAREVSILIATALGTTVLAEEGLGHRLVAAGGIVLGIAALALG
jgi:drug/metabolite transporter (DMT)-like permease